MHFLRFLTTIKNTALLALMTNRRQRAVVETLTVMVETLVTLVEESTMPDGAKIDALGAIGTTAGDLAKAFLPQR